MKNKLVTLLLLIALSTNFVACGGKEPESSNPHNTSQEASENEPSSPNLDALGEIEVDENLFDVELTIPADYVGGSTQDDLDNLAKEYGFRSITLNSDGSATYIMTKKQHQELLEEYREQINNSLSEMVGSENYPNFVKIESNDNFTEFIVTTKSAELDMNESFSIMAFYMYGGMYNVFSGESIENISVTFVDESTGEVISVSDSKDM